MAVETPTAALTAQKETAVAQIGCDDVDETTVTPPFVQLHRVPFLERADERRPVGVAAVKRKRVHRMKI